MVYSMSEDIKLNTEDNSEDLLEEAVLDRELPSSVRTTLNYTEKLYLYWLPRCTMNKAVAYKKSHPGSQESTAKKNCSRFDRTLRLKCPDGYQIVVDHYNKVKPTDEESKFQEAIVSMPNASKTQIMKTVRPDLKDTSLVKAYDRVHSNLSVKDPQWRAKLAENYDIDGALERLSDISKGKARTSIEVFDEEQGCMVETERLIPVSPETQKKAISDMLAFTGMRPEETTLDSTREAQREKHGSVIAQILNITLIDARTNE